MRPSNSLTRASSVLLTTAPSESTLVFMRCAFCVLQAGVERGLQMRHALAVDAALWGRDVDGDVGPWASGLGARVHLLATLQDSRVLVRGESVMQAGCACEYLQVQIRPPAPPPRRRLLHQGLPKMAIEAQTPTVGRARGRWPCRRGHAEGPALQGAPAPGSREHQLFCVHHHGRRSPYMLGPTRLSGYPVPVAILAIASATRLMMSMVVLMAADAIQPPLVPGDTGLKNISSASNSLRIAYADQGVEYPTPFKPAGKSGRSSTPPRWTTLRL